MKKIYSFLLIFLISHNSYSAFFAPNPCKKIEDACKMAGFTGKDKQGNHTGLRKDCVSPMLDGKIVQGVKVTPEEIRLCSIRVVKRHTKRIEVQTEARKKRLESNFSTY
jgi:hypothetical protein